MSGIDLNRAGTPLLEIVSEPDIRADSIERAAFEAVAYAKALHSLVVWIGICDGNMQEGSFRCDANVSVRPLGAAELGTRCEIKNLNSFRFMQQAIEFEARRQIELLEDGGRVVQETRLFDPDRNETRSMRSKEDAMDYRYFPDPDLLPLTISSDWIERVRAALPELPGAMRERFVREYGVSEYDAGVLTLSKAAAQYYEVVARAVSDKKVAANWVMGEVSAALNAANIPFERCPVPPAQLAKIIVRVLDGTINKANAKLVFDLMWEHLPKVVAGKLTVTLPGFREGFVFEPDEIIRSQGLEQISDMSAIEKIVDQVLATNAKSVAEFRAGKDKAFNALVGQVMKASQGKANPQQLNDILRRKLAG
jgi:aspartyl-tRNA(Asn)/glutamyl-tRNA(Gln) amidotransferase subunit B